MTAVLPPPIVCEYPTDTELLPIVLKPYRPHCQYLKTCTIKVEGEPTTGGHVAAVCAFAIPESCYIDDTGHFNSVEFNICYNQMLYYVMAKVVKEHSIAPFSHWTLDDFWSRQLADVLITDFRSSFKKAMRGRAFSGEFYLVNISEWQGVDVRQPLISLATTCRYWDEYGGYSYGEVKIAITNPPAIPQPAQRPKDDWTNLPRSTRQAALAEIVLSEFKRGLLMGDEELLSFDADYFELGLTSLRVIEIQQRLEQRLDTHIDITLFFNSLTLTEFLTQLMNGPLAEYFPQPEKSPALQQTRQVLVHNLLQNLYDS